MARSTHNSKRRGFTLVELLVVIAIIASLLGLLLPAVQSAREAARRTQCMTNIRSLSQAATVFESARLKLPAAMDRTGAKAGDATAGSYSWIFMLLPYLEDKTVYDNVSNNTSKLAKGPYDATAKSGVGGTGVNAYLLSNFSYLQCPSSGVGAVVSSGTASSMPSDVKTDSGRSAYHAMVGAYSTSGTVPSNAAGAIQLVPTATSGATTGLVGIAAGQVSDGLTKTILFIESREPSYSAWIDGCATWVTAQPGGTTPVLTSGTWGVSTSALNNSGYMNAGTGGTLFSGARAWGPSSEHAGGIVVAVFGDTHVQPVTGDTDPSVFTAWSTRASNESNGGVTQ